MPSLQELMDQMIKNAVITTEQYIKLRTTAAKETDNYGTFEEDLFPPELNYLLPDDSGLCSDESPDQSASDSASGLGASPSVFREDKTGYLPIRRKVVSDISVRDS